MRYVSEIQAIDPLSRKLKTYIDIIEIPVNTINEANQWCQSNYKGYMLITGFFVREIEATNVVVEHYRQKCQCMSNGYSEGLCWNCGLPIK